MLAEQIISPHNANRKNPIHRSIDELKYEADTIFTTHINPRLFYLIENSMIQKSQNGLIVNGKILTKEKLKHIKKIAELEIKFEQVRRQIAPTKPSRLSCLYLVEDTYQGRETLSSMFYEKLKEPIILNVKVEDNLVMFNADFRWIGEYEKNPEIAHIENYWKSIPFDDNNNDYREYLLEGSISITRGDQVEELQHLIKMNNWS